MPKARIRLARQTKSKIEIPVIAKGIISALNHGISWRLLEYMINTKDKYVFYEDIKAGINVRSEDLDYILHEFVMNGILIGIDYDSKSSTATARIYMMTEQGKRVTNGILSCLDIK